MVRVIVARCRVVAPRERWEVRPELRVIASEHANSTWGKAQYRKKIRVYTLLWWLHIKRKLLYQESAFISHASSHYRVERDMVIGAGLLVTMFPFECNGMDKNANLMMIN